MTQNKKKLLGIFVIIIALVIAGLFLIRVPHGNSSLTLSEIRSMRSRYIEAYHLGLSPRKTSYYATRYFTDDISLIALSYDMKAQESPVSINLPKDRISSINDIDFGLIVTEKGYATHTNPYDEETLALYPTTHSPQSGSLSFTQRPSQEICDTDGFWSERGKSLSWYDPSNKMLFIREETTYSGYWVKPVFFTGVENIFIPKLSCQNIDRLFMYYRVNDTRWYKDRPLSIQPENPLTTLAGSGMYKEHYATFSGITYVQGKALPSSCTYLEKDICVSDDTIYVGSGQVFPRNNRTPQEAIDFVVSQHEGIYIY